MLSIARISVWMRILVFATLLQSSVGFAVETEKVPDTTQEATHATENSQKVGQQETNLDPTTLHNDWWKFFAVDEKTFSAHSQTFLRNINSIIEGLSEENQKEAQTLIDDITANIKNFEQTKKKTPEPTPVFPPYRVKYSIEDLLRLNRLVRRITLEVKNDTDIAQEKQKAIDALSDSYDKTWTEFNNEKARNEDKMLLGLKLIDLKLALENAKINLALLKKGIENDSAALEFYKGELAFAKSNISTNQMQLSSLKHDIPRSEDAWTQAYRIFRQKEYSQSLTEVSAKTPLKNAESQLAQEDILEDEINASLNHVEFISNEIKQALVQHYLNSNNTDIAELKSNSVEWETQLKQYQSRFKDWNDTTQRHIQRLGQALSLASNKDEDADAIRQVQQSTLQKAQNNLLLIQRFDASLSDNLFLLKLVNEKILAPQGERPFVSSLKDFFNESSESISSLLNKTLFTINNTSVTLASILRFGIIVLLSMWISRVVATALSTFAQRQKGMQKSLVYRITRLIQYLILFLGIIFGMAAMGFDFSNFILLASALGVGLGFGLQAIFNNFISGIILLFESELNVGDFVELDGGIKGEIREIKVRNTIISTGDGLDILVPNSQLINNKVTNWTLRDPYRSVRVPFTVAGSNDRNLVIQVAKDVAKKTSCTLNKIGTPEPKVYLTHIGGNLDFELVVWVNEKAAKRTLSTLSEYFWNLLEAFQANGIKFPSTQYDLSLKEVLGSTSANELWKDKDNK